MKYKFFYTIACLLFTSLMVKAQGINFQKGAWADIKAKAKVENKYIFVDAYTTWCRPCKWQSKKVFPQKKVGDFFNKNFISFKMDMEKGEGVSFAKKYKVTSFPTLIYFNPQGEIVHKTLGAYPANKLLKGAANALNPETQVCTLQRRFDKGEKNNEFIAKYVKALKSANGDFTKLVELYLTQLGKDKWATAQGWEFISNYVHKPSHEAFAYVTQNKRKFEQVAKKKEEVKNYITEVWRDDMNRMLNTQNKAQLEIHKQKLAKALGKEATEYIARAEFWFYLNDKGTPFQVKYKYACKYFDEHCNDYYDLYQGAYGVFLETNDPQVLKKVLVWTEKSIKILKTFDNMGTKAEVLYKLKRYKEAKKVAEETLILGKKEKVNPAFIKDTKALIKKIDAKF